MSDQPVLEHAILHIRAGQSPAFEAAFAEARKVIAATPGARSVRLHRCVEVPDQYLLLVEWDTIEAHTEGFRGSPAFAAWRALVGGFWDPMPTVEHFVEVAGG